ncbi:MAG: hypothetical protein AB1428_13035 [Bacteroidota bacterium]
MPRIDIESERQGIGRIDSKQPRNVEVFGHVPSEGAVYHFWMTREQAVKLAEELLDLYKPEHVDDEEGWLPYYSIRAAKGRNAAQ